MHDLSLRDAGNNLHVVVEVPRGSAVKLKYDEHTGTFMWSRRIAEAEGSSSGQLSGCHRLERINAFAQCT